MNTLRMRNFRGTYVAPQRYRRLVILRFVTVWRNRIDSHRQGIMTSAIVTYGAILAGIGAMVAFR